MGKDVTAGFIFLRNTILKTDQGFACKMFFGVNYPIPVLFNITFKNAQFDEKTLYSISCYLRL